MIAFVKECKDIQYPLFPFSFKLWDIEHDKNMVSRENLTLNVIEHVMTTLDAHNYHEVQKYYTDNNW